MKSSLFILLGAVSLSACAQNGAPEAPTPVVAAKPGSASTKADLAMAALVPGTPAAKARDALQEINPSVRIEQIADAPLPGFQQVIVGGQVVYVSDDGKYLMQGALYDIAAKQDLGEVAMARLRTKLLSTVPVSDRIVFAPANPKYTVTVFTDVECGFCRKFHSEIADYNKQGIAVEYLAFPRMGPASEDFKKMVGVWCAADPKKALTDAKSDRKVDYKNCTNPVAMQYSLGQRMGLTGTPMILTSDGTQLGGYVPPDKLREELDQLAADGIKPPVSDATGSL